MSGDLWGRIMRLYDLLDLALKELRQRAREYGEAEAAYRTALADRELRLRADGMAASLVSDVARGDRDVAQKLIDRICKEALYKAALEAINIYKLQLKVLEAQYEREWGNTK